MLLLGAILGFSAQVYALARWSTAGPAFFSLVQFLMMGLAGAFLTGDLFNLFVFFEVLLAASYGLALHGSGAPRVRAGLHYIAINLAASMLFLIGVSLIYGVTGTLNMADLATRIAAIPSESRPLFDAGLALLGIAFLVKAGMWPLSFWLPATYGAASAPVAAIFAIMSKVGIYVLLRLSGLLGAELDGFGHDWMFFGGMATMLFGTVGVLSSQELPRMTGFAVLLSSGTVLAMLGYGDPGVTAGVVGVPVGVPDGGNAPALGVGLAQVGLGVGRIDAHGFAALRVVQQEAVVVAEAGELVDLEHRTHGRLSCHETPKRSAIQVNSVLKP